MVDAALAYEFIHRLAGRWITGKRDHGDKSFERAASEIADKEIGDEILDFAGWAFPLWVQAKRLVKTIESLEVKRAKLFVENMELRAEIDRLRGQIREDLYLPPDTTATIIDPKDIPKDGPLPGTEQKELPPCQ